MLMLMVPMMLPDVDVVGRAHHKATERQRGPFVTQLSIVRT